MRLSDTQWNALRALDPEDRYQRGGFGSRTWAALWKRGLVKARSEEVIPASASAFGTGTPHDWAWHCAFMVDKHSPGRDLMLTLKGLKVVRRHVRETGDGPETLKSLFRF